MIIRNSKYTVNEELQWFHKKNIQLTRFIESPYTLKEQLYFFKRKQEFNLNFAG